MALTAKQWAYWRDMQDGRFTLCAAARRSGKTWLGLQHAVEKACRPPYYGARYGCFAPTFVQARDIFWDELVSMTSGIRVPQNDGINRSLHEIYLVTGAVFVLKSLERPERVEGTPWAHVHISEAANVRPEAWPLHIRPALDTLGKEGTATIEGVPEGRNWWYELCKPAMLGEPGCEFRFHTWHTAEVLPAPAIEAARRNLDPLVFRQEYEGEFVDFAGRAYYNFADANKRKGDYDPYAPLILCFDFNVEPGTATVVQEKDYGAHVIDEIYIQRGSNTVIICDRILSLYGKHQGAVLCYGDSTGGARGTAKISGSDWDLIRQHLAPIGAELRVRKVNPPERQRVNAVNSALLNAAGIRRLFVDPDKCPMLVRDLEGVRCEADGSLDKSEKHLTHLSDGVGYYIATKSSAIDFSRMYG